MLQNLYPVRQLTSASAKVKSYICLSFLEERRVFSDILLLLRVVQHGTDTVTFYLLLNVFFKCR